MSGRATLFAGVAGACVLGAGLGLWARPAADERHLAMAPAREEAPPPISPGRTLQIVVNDGPAAPAGAPIEVLPKAAPPLFASLRPARASSGGLSATPELTRLEPRPWPKLETPKLEAPHFALPDLAPLMADALAIPGHWLQKAKVEAAPAPQAAPVAAPERQRRMAAIDTRAAERAAQAQQARIEAQAKADAEARAQAAEDRAAKQAARRQATRLAAQQRAAAHRIELAKLAQAQEAAAAKAEQVRLAQAHEASLQQAKLEADRRAHAKARQAALQQARLADAKAARTEQQRLAKAEKAEALKLAQAEAKGRAEARAEARAMVVAEAREEAKKRERLEALVHAVQKVLPRAQSQTAQVAKLDHRHTADRRHAPQVERASLKTHKAAPHAVEPPARSHPVPVAPANPSGLMRVSTPRCASHDPGAALVCADPALSAADRQLARAYQGARAAGVPDGQLQAQQQRWLAARSAAAREAPWAVRDVYLARIAELNSQARDAHGDGY